MSELFFSFDKYAEALSEIINEHKSNHSFVAAITGTWGSGKTTLMEKTIEKLPDEGFIKTTFNPWRYTKEDAVWRGFFISILTAFRAHIKNSDQMNSIGWTDTEINLCNDLLDEVETTLYTAFTQKIPGEAKLDWGNLAKTGFKLGLKFIPWGQLGSEIIEKIFLKKKDGKEVDEQLNPKDIDNLFGIVKRTAVKRQVEKLESMEQFRVSMEMLLKSILEGYYEKKDSKDKKLKPLKNKSFQLVVGIDDLDRCLPEKALEIFEAIKLFMNLPKTHFIIAIDQDIIQYALNLRYKQDDSSISKIRAERYIEKMIDLSFNVPSLLEENFKDYIETKLSSNGKMLIESYNLLNLALSPNLRTWQRFSKKVDLNIKIIKNIIGDEFKAFENESFKAGFFKLQALAYRWPEIFRKIDNLKSYHALEIELSYCDLKNRKDKELSQFVKEQVNTASKVTIAEEILNCIYEEKFVKFIQHEPIISKNSFDLLNIVFSLDTNSKK